MVGAIGTVALWRGIVVQKIPIVTPYHSFTFYMEMLNAEWDYQIRVIGKNFRFTQTFKYNTRLYDTNKRRKIGPLCFEQIWVLNSVIIPWFPVFLFLFFCVELSVRKYIGMITVCVTVGSFLKVSFWKFFDHSYI